MKKILMFIGFTFLSFFIFIQSSYADKISIPKKIPNGTPIYFTLGFDWISGQAYEKNRL